MLYGSSLSLSFCFFVCCVLPPPRQKSTRFAFARDLWRSLRTTDGLEVYSRSSHVLCMFIYSLEGFVIFKNNGFRKQKKVAHTKPLSS